MKAIISLAVLLIASSVDGRVYTRCELAWDLVGRAFFAPRAEDWHCLIENESGFNTNAVGVPNTDGSRDWGLFQINDRYWCGRNGVDGDCNIACESFLVENGVGACQPCVQLIYARHGFDAWHGWTRGCQNGLPDLGKECGIDFSKYKNVTSTSEN